MAFDYREVGFKVVGALKPDFVILFRYHKGRTMDELKALFVSQFKPSTWLSNLFIHPVVIVVFIIIFFNSVECRGSCTGP